MRSFRSLLRLCVATKRPRNSLAHPVVVKCFLKIEKQQVMLIRHLNLLLCCLKVQACSNEKAMRVPVVNGKAQVRGHRKANLLRQVTARVDVADYAVEDQASNRDAQSARTTQPLAISFSSRALTTSWRKIASVGTPVSSSMSKSLQQTKPIRLSRVGAPTVGRHEPHAMPSSGERGRSGRAWAMCNNAWHHVTPVCGGVDACSVTHAWGVVRCGCSVPPAVNFMGVAANAHDFAMPKSWCTRRGMALLQHCKGFGLEPCHGRGWLFQYGNAAFCYNCFKDGPTSSVCFSAICSKCGGRLHPAKFWAHAVGEAHLVSASSICRAVTT